MGHRAFVAYEQRNGTFNLHYSHWGAHDLELCSRIDENHPLGGPNDLEPDFLTALTQTLTDAADNQDLEITGRATERQDEKCVEPEPRRTNITIGAVVEEATERDIESLYVVEQDFSVHGYSIEHIAFNDEYVGNLLFDPRYLNGDPIGLANTSGYIRGVKAQLNNLVMDGTLSVADAHDAFLDTVLSKFERGVNKHILGHSTVIPDDMLNDYRNAFIECSGQTRLFGVMIPNRYGDIKPWQIPDGLTLPPEYDQFTDLIDAIPETEDADASQQTFDSFESGTPDRTLDRPADTDLPDVSVPTLPFDSEITVDGHSYSQHNLTLDIADAFREYLNGLGDGHIGLTKVHECDDCRERDDAFEHGYLTTSSNVGEYRNTYSCPHSWTVESVLLHALTGRHAPETWDVALTVNGDDERILDENQDTDDREYTVIVRAMEEYEYNGEVTEETTVTITPSNIISESDPDPYPVLESITGETAGKSWEAVLVIHEESADLEWERVGEDGNVREFAYREETVEGQTEYDPLGFVPVDVDTDDADVTVEKMEASTRSNTLNRSCENEEFTRVWPPTTYSDSILNPNSVTPSDVPNSTQHLSQIQGDIEDVADSEMLEDWVAIAAYHTWETYGPDTRHEPVEDTENPTSCETTSVAD